MGIEAAAQAERRGWKPVLRKSVIGVLNYHRNMSFQPMRAILMKGAGVPANFLPALLRVFLRISAPPRPLQFI